MVRRIAAIVLALTILLSVIPAGVFAEDDHIYDIGETIWVTGIGNRPGAQTVENGYWEESIGPDGEQVKQPGCTKEIHEHTPEECWDAVYGLVCTKEEHTARRHNLVCSFLESKYQWYVASKPVEPGNPGDGGEGGGGELETDGSGVNDPLGLINFDIVNLDAEGNPLAGFTFSLFHWDGESYAYLQNENLRLEQQKKLDQMQQDFEQQQLQQQEKIQELQEQGDMEKLNAYYEQINAQNQEAVERMNTQTQEALEQMNGQEDALLSKETNADGKAGFHAVEKYLSESHQVAGAEKPTWRMRLLQSSAPEGYKPHKLVWEVIIVRNSEDDYSVNVNPMIQKGTTYEPAKESDLNQDKGEGYADGVFTFINGRMNLKLMGFVEFVDETGEKIPDSVVKDISATIVLTNSEDYQGSMTFPVADAKVEAQKWQTSLPAGDQAPLNPGTYTVQGEPQYTGEIDGYEFVSCAWNMYPSGNRNETPVQEIFLGETYEAASVVLTAVYRALDPAETTEPTEPEIPGKYTIVARSVDKDGKQIDSAQFTLTHKTTGETISGQVRGSDCRFEMDTADCTVGEYRLEESKEPAGFMLNKDTYTIVVKENGEVEVFKDGILRRLFARDCDAEEIITFKHTRLQAKTGLTCNVEAEVRPGCRNPEDTRKEFEARVHKFELTWGDGNSETLALKNGETKQFNAVIPYGAKYKITPLDAHEFNYRFTGAHEGIFDGTPLDLEVEIQYIVELSEDLDLDVYFINVDSRTKKPLANASFTLKNPSNQQIGTFTTQKDGRVDIEDMIYTNGMYTLKETKAPDQYDAIRKPIEIHVVNAYDVISRGGEKIQVQRLKSEIDHKSVEKLEEESYRIKNTASGDNPKTGDSFDMVLWTGMMAVSLAGLLTVAAGSRKKRSGR